MRRAISATLPSWSIERWKKAGVGIVVLSLVAVGAQLGAQLQGAKGAPLQPVSFSRPAAPSRASTASQRRQMFPVSLFDRGVAAQPVAAGSALIVANLVAQYHTYFGSIGVNQMPILTVPANQPPVPITVKSGCNNFTYSTGTAIPIPAGAYTTDPLYQHDSAIIISQPSTSSAWELWKAANKGDGTWSACWGGKLNTGTSTGVFPWPVGLAASGISYAATAITEADVQSGSINHTIAMDVVQCNSYTPPANRGDCAIAVGQPAEGTWFRMPASVPMPAHLTPYAQMAFRALQTYGAVVTDYAGAVMLQGESTKDWAFGGGTGTDPITTAFAGKPQYAVLTGMPWANMEVIQPLS